MRFLREQPRRVLFVWGVLVIIATGFLLVAVAHDFLKLSSENTFKMILGGLMSSAMFIIVTVSAALISEGRSRYAEALGLTCAVLGFTSIPGIFIWIILGFRFSEIATYAFAGGGTIGFLMFIMTLFLLWVVDYIVDHIRWG